MLFKNNIYTFHIYNLIIVHIWTVYYAFCIYLCTQPFVLICISSKLLTVLSFYLKNTFFSTQTHTHTHKNPLSHTFSLKIDWETEMQDCRKCNSIYQIKIHWTKGKAYINFELSSRKQQRVRNFPAFNLPFSLPERDIYEI